jgi:3-hydroxy-9,10-secoandrosta-1,3,5(10)-triene-9,17-dione monooxygenase
MADSVTAGVTEVPAPEPDLAPREIIARAQALIPQIREQQDEAELLGHHTDDLDREFVKAGFYRTLQPRRFGGYEFDMPTFWKAMLAISTGDPGTGWGLTLGTHHALVVGAYWSLDGQREIFGPAGEFRCPARAAPQGTAEPAEGGYVVTGTWDYASGIAHATHFMGNALVPPGDEREEPLNIVVVIPRDQVTVLDDWGDGVTLGMNSSGSNGARVEGVFVPEHCTSVSTWTRRTEPAPGMALHGNPLYCGRIYGPYHVGLVIPMIGAARAALEEYEQIIRTKKTIFGPQVPRYTHPEFQRAYGHALALTDTAEAIILQLGEQYMELAQSWADGGEPFTREMDVRMYAMTQQAGQLAVRAVTELFAAASSSAAKRGQRMQRYYRDVSMYHGHISAQYLSTAGELARVHFGLPDALF